MDQKKKKVLDLKRQMYLGTEKEGKASWKEEQDKQEHRGEKLMQA